MRCKQFKNTFPRAIFCYTYDIIYMPKRTQKTTGKKKNPAAVALGRLGGLKGGPARMAKLSAKGRSELARKAVLTRWSKKTKNTSS
jgi:hypothetical protein